MSKSKFNLLYCGALFIVLKYEEKGPHSTKKKNTQDIPGFSRGDYPQKPSYETKLCPVVM